MSKYDELLQDSGNFAIVDMAIKCESVFRSHQKALVSISGGADSDVVMDLCERVRTAQDIQVDYVWFDTGVEYDATKRHLVDLEGKYGVRIRRERAEKVIPTCTREHGQPVFSKFISENIEKLQSVGFDWSDEDFETLLKRYDGVAAELRWWTDSHPYSDGRPSRFSILRKACLKEFMLSCPPEFKVSAKCCTYAKKRVGDRVEREGQYDLHLIGVRKAEGGVRAMNSATCFTSAKRKGVADVYRPLFWLTDADKDRYCRAFGVTHSDCYEVWGFKRTGCVGCPFNPKARRELAIASIWEPKVTRAARRMFKDAYEYQDRLRAWKRTKRLIERQNRME